MEFEELTRIGILTDFYGALLTDKQQLIMQLYYEDNFSLSEIAEEINISRQGVHDALKKASLSLEDYEEKLRLIEKFKEMEKSLDRIVTELNYILEDKKENSKLEEKLLNVKELIDKLEY